MRKEFIETEKIEDFLMHRMDAGERRLFEVNMLLDPSLAEKTEAQAGVYKLVRRFWRKQTRKQLSLIYRQLLKETPFAQQIQ
ncbi:MAG TPA: hypothetical protein VFR58_06435 [Flavisolibacter sp.]|nr:hypothetical protein [Flavisolibacter sp.]